MIRLYSNLGMKIGSTFEHFGNTPTHLIIQELLANNPSKIIALNPRIIGVLKSYTSPSPSDI